MKRWLKLTLCAILVLSALLVPSRARADVAPPMNPPGSNPQTGRGSTQVRMMAETVLIDVQANAPSNSLGQARVTANFTMRNLGSQAESMTVGFPISNNDGFYKYPEITELSVKVNGKTVLTHRTSGNDPRYDDETVPWAEFQATFPPGQDVPIQVSYTLNGSGEYPYIAFYYILATGAGWKDTIGSAEVVLRLPYEANPQNVILETQTGWSQTTPGGIFSGNEVRWHYENLEPTIENNMEISLVMPSAWKKVLTERDNVSRNPNDGEAWGRLGKIYKEITFLRKDFRRDAGGRELYNLSMQAYEKAVTLLPDDALWHAGFADLLAFHALYSSYEGLDTTAEFVRALAEIHTALALKPNDPKVLEIADNIYYFFPGAMERNGDTYDFPWLTATPTPLVLSVTETPTLEPTSTPFATPVPSQPTHEAPTPTGTSKLPFCGSALLVPLGAGLLVANWRKKRKISS